MTPRISIVIPAYNNARTLGETITSVLDQDVADMEVIVADHASSDDTLAVMHQFKGDERVVLLETEAGGGAGRNWNRVTDAAHGTFVKLVCGDDVLRPGVVARQAALLETTGAVLTACRRDLIDAHGGLLLTGWGLRGLTRQMPGVEAVRRAVRAGSNLFGEPASVMLRRDVLARTGGWFDRFSYFIDQATYTRVLFEGDFVPDPEVGAAFRMSDTQWSVALASRQASEAREFHAWAHSARPNDVSTIDRRIGDARAALMARARQVSYRLLKRRMR